MRIGVSVRVSGTSGALFSGIVPYAAAQELGTARRPGRHFLESGMAAAGAVLNR